MMKVWQWIVAFRWTTRRRMQGAFDLAYIGGMGYANSHARRLEEGDPEFAEFERLARQRIKALFVGTVRNAKGIRDLLVSAPKLHDKIRLLGAGTAREVLGIPPHEWRPILADTKADAPGFPVHDWPVGCATCGAHKKLDEWEAQHYLLTVSHQVFHV